MARLADKNGTPVWKWKVKSNSVKLGSLNENIIRYIDSLPSDVQERILATSGNDSGHSKTSRHYHNNAIDLRFDDKVWSSIEKDPNRLKFGLSLINPNHGTGKHIHLSHGNGTENKSDVWLDPYSTKAQNLIAGLGDTSTNTNIASTTPTTTTSTEVIPSNNEGLVKMLEQIRGDIQLDRAELERNSYLTAAEQERVNQETQRLQDRNLILDGIAGNSLEFKGREFDQKAAYMAQGGEISALDENINFKINAIKGMTPPIDTSTLEQLQASTAQIQARMQKNEDLLQQTSLLAQVQSPTIVNNTTNTTSSIEGEDVKDVTEVKEGAITDGAGTKRAIFEELSQLGLKSHQIAGVIGSLSGESSPNLKVDTYGDNNTSFGIAQWHKGRFTNLKNFSKKNNMDFKTAEAQVKYLRHELETDYKGVLTEMLRTNTVEDATKVWTNKFEKPSTAAYRKSIGDRIRYAKEYFKSLK